jgi:hypothetical protein
MCFLTGTKWIFVYYLEEIQSLMGYTKQVPNMSEENHCYTNLSGGNGKINNKLAIILR